MSNKPRTATVYLQVRQGGPRSTYGPSTATVMASTNTYPSSVKPGCVVVKLKVTVPSEAWLPLAAAEVEVPLNQIVIEAESVLPAQKEST